MAPMKQSFFIGALTLAIGRTTLLQGVVHVIISLNTFLSLVPLKLISGLYLNK